MSRRRADWVYINVPREIVERIDAVVASRKYGYVSRADFVLDAIRDKLRELGYYP
ncbi:MAG TPA: CopG family transcriptional regulator [Candidatus Bathyarchaeota archaeon]|nr:CopG family transcriptional regulator [Candidatus Bathyarchaeota archaeon]